MPSSLGGLKRAVIGTPGKESVVGAVPDTGEEESDEDIEIMASGAYAIAAERDVDIMGEPAR